MSIQYQKESRTITIDTLHTTYQLRVDPHGFLQHLYYGKKIQGQDMSYLYQDYDRACAGNPDEAYPSRRISFNTASNWILPILLYQSVLPKNS